MTPAEDNMPHLACPQDERDRIEAGDAGVPEPTAPVLEPHSRRPELPWPPFLNGTFSFPLSADARFHALLLSVWAMLFLGLAWESGKLAVIGEGRLAFLSAMVGAGALLLATTWFLVASACALALVRDTANGCDNIQNWPDMMFLDYLGEPLYLLDGLGLSVLPGAGLAWLAARSGLPGALAAPALTLFFLFPVVLLSMLETNSPFGAISLPVWRTLRMAREGWAAFYLTAAGLLAAAAVVAAGAMFVGRVYGVFIAAPILTAAWFIYFRLLGRLAWYCADRTVRAGPEDESDDDESMDNDLGS